jgi:microcystin-dependent protein
VPIAGIIQWPVNVAPTGFAICDGASYLTADYPAASALLRPVYGGVDATHFNVPNSKGRVKVGVDPADTTWDVVGESAGGKTHSHSLSSNGWAMIRQAANILQRRISVSSWTGTHSTTTSAAATDTTASTSGAELGGATDAGTTIQPFIAFHDIIRLI